MICGMSAAANGRHELQEKPTMSDVSNVTGQPTYFSRFAHLRMKRDVDGILLVENAYQRRADPVQCY
jgi:hypothetical protein